MITNFKKIASSACTITILSTTLAFEGPVDEVMIIEPSKYQTRLKVGKVDMLTYDGRDFKISQSGRTIRVHRYDLDKSLRGRTVNELSRLLKNNGYLVLKKIGNDIAIDAEQRILSGSSHGKQPGQMTPSQVDGARYEGLAQAYKKQAEEEKKAKQAKKDQNKKGKK